MDDIARYMTTVEHNLECRIVDIFASDAPVLLIYTCVKYRVQLSLTWYVQRISREKEQVIIRKRNFVQLGRELSHRWINHDRCQRNGHHWRWRVDGTLRCAAILCVSLNTWDFHISWQVSSFKLTWARVIISQYIWNTSNLKIQFVCGLATFRNHFEFVESAISEWTVNCVHSEYYGRKLKRRRDMSALHFKSTALAQDCSNSTSNASK